jgi:phosphocarrier protein HPr
MAQYDNNGCRSPDVTYQAIEEALVSSITLTVNHSSGLHARPAALFVKTAKQFNSAITVSHNGKEANAKSILTILTLGVNKGSKISICAEGEDADEALVALESLIQNNFGEAE